jgi:DNA-binding LacI/PurR family transcriptional regulator
MILTALRTMGLEPGEDLAVMGVDDIPLAAMGLTTIAISTEVFTAALIERVVAALEQREPVPPTEPTLRLVVRSSA